MALWHRVWSLGAADRRLLVEAGVMLLLARIGLWVLPFPALRRVLDGARPARRELQSECPARVAWAVAAVARRLPGMTCLVQSLAAHALLHRRGHSAALHIGVHVDRVGPVAGGASDDTDMNPGSGRRGVRGRGTSAGASLEAHAWVECEGRVVAGAVENLVDYRVLSPVGPPASPTTTGPA